MNLCYISYTLCLGIIKTGKTHLTSVSNTPSLEATSRAPVHTAGAPSTLVQTNLILYGADIFSWKIHYYFCITAFVSTFLQFDYRIIKCFVYLCRLECSATVG